MPDSTTFLLIEDDDIDFWAIQRAFKHLKISHPLLRASDGVEALDILSQHQTDKSFSEAYIILLDLNLPRMSGFEFLERLKAMPTFKDTPVIITSTSDANRDTRRARELGVAGYVQKCDLVEGLKKPLRDLGIYAEHPGKTKLFKKALEARLPKLENGVPA